MVEHTECNRQLIQASPTVSALYLDFITHKLSTKFRHSMTGRKASQNHIVDEIVFPWGLRGTKLESVVHGLFYRLHTHKIQAIVGEGAGFIKTEHSYLPSNRYSLRIEAVYTTGLSKIQR